MTTLAPVPFTVILTKTNTPYAGSPTNTPSPPPSWTPSNTPTLFVTLTPTPSDRTVFEDFNTFTLINGIRRGDLNASAFYLFDPAVEGPVGLNLSIDSAVTGMSIGFDSNYGIISAPQAKAISFWMNTTQSLNFSVQFGESYPSGYEKELWGSIDLVYPCCGWEYVSVPLDWFTEDLSGNAACAPNCDLVGNNVMDLDKIQDFRIKFEGGLVLSDFRLDYITFNDDTAWTRTPTATLTTFISATPTLSFTPSPIVSATPTATATHTETITPTATPTATATHTPTATPTPFVPTCAGGPTFGKTDVGGAMTSLIPRTYIMSKHTLPENGQVRSIWVYVDAPPTDGVILAIYNNNGSNEPQNIVAVSMDYVPIAGWQEFYVQSEPILTAGIYWIAVMAETNLQLRMDIGSLGDGWDPPVPAPIFRLFADPALAGAFTDKVISMYVDYCPLGTPTATPTHTVSPTDSPTYTNSPTATISATSTISPTPMPATMPDPIIDQFEDMDYISRHGGSITSQQDLVGSSILTGFAAVSPTGSALHGSGTLVQDTGNNPYAYIGIDILPGAWPVDIYTVSQTHVVNFSFRSLIPGVTYRFHVMSNNVSDMDYYQWEFTPADTLWNDYSVFFPDVVGASLTLSQQGFGAPVTWAATAAVITGVMIQPVESIAGPVVYDFEIDDIDFLNRRPVNSVGSVATLLGVTDDVVKETRLLNLPPLLRWIIMRLTIYCGLTPTQILDLRATMSWGEIAVSCGQTWEDILLEIDTLTGPLVCEDPTMIEMERALENTPDLIVTVTPEIYVEPGAFFPLNPVSACP